jgi:hypothetical protein
MLHQIIQPDALHSALSEKLSCRRNNSATVFRSLFSSNGQSLIPETDFDN